jgi:hypothetical protein
MRAGFPPNPHFRFSAHSLLKIDSFSGSIQTPFHSLATALLGSRMT